MMRDFPSEGGRGAGDFASAVQGGGRRLPPHHLEAERSVLGAILVQNDMLDRVRDVGLEPRDFYREAHQKIFETALGLHERREPIDLVTLTGSLRDKGWYDQIGGSETLTSLFDDAFAIGNTVTYARIVRDKAVQRRVIEVCSEIIGEAFEGIENTEEFLDRTESKVFAVADTSVNAALTPLRSVLVNTVAAIEDLRLKDKDVTGLGTGFRDFDNLTTGLHGGQIMILAARPGMGKTSWFISAIQHAAINQGAVAAIFSLEMSKEEIGFRFLSGLSRIDSKRLKTGKLHDRDFHRLLDATDKLAKAKIYIDDSGGVTIMDIRARCRRLLATEKRLDLVVIDYLQLMKGSKASQKEGSREREISEISRGLKELAKELKVPIIALSQLNRGVESRQDKRPMLSDLRESGSIEQDADLVCFIYRDDYYDKESEEKGIAELIIAKNRAGEQSTVRMAWLGQYTLFADLDPSQPGTPMPPDAGGGRGGGRVTADDISL